MAYQCFMKCKEKSVWIPGTSEGAGIHTRFLYCFCNYVLLSIFLRLKLIPDVAATSKYSGQSCPNLTISCINPGISYKNHPDFSRIAVMSISLCIGLAALG